MDHAYLGDPDGMETLASELLLRAESISGIAASLARQVDSMIFEGPAADRLREDMHVRRRRAERVAAELQGTAQSLKRNAAAIRDRIYELRLAEARREERE